jgi:hypothetical protein
VIRFFLKILIVTLAVAASAGCSDKYKVDKIASPENLIPLNSHFYVMVPEDGRYGETHYVGSSKMVVDAIDSVLARHSDKVTRAATGENLKQALMSAKSMNIDYVFQPVIMHWEDRATEWSGRPDRITMKYTIYETMTGRDIASTVTRASSKWGTFGGDHPQDLVPKTVENFINSVSK